MLSATTRRDFVAGLGAASVTSYAAMRAAVSTGSAYADEGSTTFESTITWNGVYDVVVVGFGGAGAVAAITAADNGAKVLLLEKAPEGHDGGNTRYCMQIVLWIRPELIDDGIEYFKRLRGSYSTPSDSMIETYVRGAAETKGWLEEMGGEPLISAELSGLAAVEPIVLDGETYTSKFWRFVKGLVTDRADSIDVWYESPATRIIRDPFTGVVLGVSAMVDGNEVNIRARNGVVMTCGGYEANQQMVQDYAHLTECYALGSLYNTGDGITMATEAGAALWHMDNIMGPYLGVKLPGWSRAQVYSGNNIAKNYAGGFIIVGPDGTRFQNECAELRHGLVNFHGNWQHAAASLPAYLVFDSVCLAESPMIALGMAKDLTAYVESGDVKMADDIAGLAEQIGVDPDSLTATVERYNGFCEQGVDYEFGRGKPIIDILSGTEVSTNLQAFAESGPYYAVELKPWMINTQGGPVRNEDGQVVDVNGEPIPHLYAAGEFGMMMPCCYQGSGNLGDNVVFGRISGANAAAPKDDDQPADDLAVEAVAPAPKEEPVWEVAENEYVGSAEGLCGQVVVKVAVADDGTIEEVTVLDTMETDIFGGRAEAEMPARFAGLTADEVYDVDGVTLATFTSVAIRSAVADALSKAKA